MIYLSIRGQASNAEVWFKDANNNPITPLESVKYEVRDYNDSYILGGTAVQDVGDNSHWTTIFTIPTTAPVGQAGNKYRIIWTLIDINNQFYSQTEYFLLVAEGEPPPRELNVVMLQGDPFTDTIALNNIPSRLTVAVHDVKGTVLMSAADVDTSVPRYIGDLLYFDFNTGITIPQLLAGNNGATPAFAIWRYDLPSLPNQLEIHPIYVLNEMMFNWINNLRVNLDKSHNEDIDGTLNFTEAEMCHYVLNGLQRINVTPPQNTLFDLFSIPPSFSYLVTQAAMVEALRAWYLAEGMKAFEFQGQSTQLNIDRTPFIQNLLDQLNSTLEEDIRKAKKIWMRSGGGSRYGMGSLNISLHRGTNIPYRAPYSFLSNYRWFR